MDTKRKIEALERLIQKATEIESETFSSPAFQSWKNLVERTFIRLFEAESIEVQQFNNTSFVYRGMLGGVDYPKAQKSAIQRGFSTTIRSINNYIDEFQEELELEEENPVNTNTNYELDTSKVFIVHGHDELAKTETARFIEKLNLEPIILHEQASSGNTIIEKIEENTDVGFGIVLYTPCDIGSKKDDENLKSRARQNVIFEHGYLIGKLGRQKVCALVKEDLELPNDISGVVYIHMDKHGAWKIGLAKELREAGYSIDMNLVV